MKSQYDDWKTLQMLLVKSRFFGSALLRVQR